MLDITLLYKESDFDKIKETRQEFVDHLHKSLGEYGDTKEAINKCIDYAFSADKSAGGFLMTGHYENELAGTLIMNNTGMSDYIPENILVYVAVAEDFRGKGLGTQIVEESLNHVKGDVKLHVEYENPAKRLYERMGFESKYLEMRYTNK